MVEAGSLDGKRQSLQHQAYPNDRHLCACISLLSSSLEKPQKSCKHSCLTRKPFTNACRCALKHTAIIHCEAQTNMIKCVLAKPFPPPCCLSLHKQLHAPISPHALHAGLTLHKQHMQAMRGPGGARWRTSSLPSSTLALLCCIALRTLPAGVSLSRRFSPALTGALDEL